eukprot:1196003-Prorocentrum_minimum.AAC.5
MSCAEWFSSVDNRRLSTVELKSKAFLAVDSGAWDACRGVICVFLFTRNEERLECVERGGINKQADTEGKAPPSWWTDL